MAGWLGGWVAGWLGGWVAGWLGGWVAGWLDGWVAGWLGGWVAGWLGGWVAGWLGGWVGVCVCVCGCGCVCVLSCFCLRALLLQFGFQGLFLSLCFHNRQQTADLEPPQLQQTESLHPQPGAPATSCASSSVGFLQRMYRA